MTENLKVDIHHLTRVEGHGNIVVKVKDGKVAEARWDVVETPRFFEVMLRGKHYTTAGILTARICGICSIGHCLASIRATENAFGVRIPETAAKLRLLAKHGETLQSHALHLFFLAAPDFVNLPSAIPLLDSNPAVVGIACRLKQLGNDICDVVAGRTTHPVALQVGGVSRMPARDALLRLQERLKGTSDDLAATVSLFASFQIPDFTRETEFVSLGGKGYPWIGGTLVSTDGVTKKERDYLAMTNEYLDAANTTKWCRLSRESFAVGALARFNNNFSSLDPAAAGIAARLGLKPVCHNPFMNNVAQLVETVHVVNESVRLMDELMKEKNPKTFVDVKPKAGEGVGAVEVPRGILYHHYRYNREGRIVKANCIIPTTQNNLNIHLDIKALAAGFSARPDMTDEKLGKLCSMLVRAYDPCISCSVH